MSAFGVIIGARGGFPDKLVAPARKKILDKLRQYGHEAVITGPDDTSCGGVKVLQDAKKCAALFRENSSRIDGIIICLPNFGEESAIVEAVRLSGLNVPILVQADPDRLDRLGVDERGGAYCGKISVCNNLYQYGIPFTNTKKHVTKLDSREFEEDLQRFASVCSVVAKLKHARIGLIGARPGLFNTLRYSEKLLVGSGMATVTEDFSEILGRAQNYKDQAKIQEKIEEIRDYADVSGLGAESGAILDRIARMSLVLGEWVEQHEVDASSVLCWTSAQEYFGCAPCLPMAMMTSAGKPSACESDTLSAVSMLALQAAAGSPAFCQDWYLPYQEEACVCIHCSNFAKEVFREKPHVGVNCVQARRFGDNNCAGALKGTIRPGGMTYLKITTDDKHGRIKAYVGEGEILEADIDFYSPYAVCEIPRLEQLLDYVCKQGFEHHFTMVHGKVADVVAEAMETYLGWDVYRH